jgi:hypothetical protein
MTTLRRLPGVTQGLQSTDGLIVLCVLDRGGNCPPLPGLPRNLFIDPRQRHESYRCRIQALIRKVPQSNPHQWSHP